MKYDCNNWTYNGLTIWRKLFYGTLMVAISHKGRDGLWMLSLKYINAYKATFQFYFFIITNLHNI